VSGSADTELARVVKSRSQELKRLLMGVCAKRGVRGMDAEQAVGDAFAIAFEHEHKGEHWNPALKPAEQYLVGILLNVFRKRRRNAARMGTSDLDEAATVASDAATIDVVLIELEEHLQFSTEVRQALMVETKAGLTVRILDALREGIVGQTALSSHLKCSIPDVRAAYKRIHGRLTDLRGKGVPS
jgi:DNA-directed RNA polymerase specialized sigma24 family protein